MESEIVPDPVTEALKATILRALEPGAKVVGSPQEIIDLVECYRGVRDDDRLLKLEAAVGNLAQIVDRLRGEGSIAPTKPKSFGEALG